MKQRGVFEKERGSGVWWIRYFDQFCKKRREKAGSKSVAIKLYGKRKQQVLEGKKLPEAFRQPSVNFNQLLDDAVAHSKRNKRSYKPDVPRFARLKEWFGFHPAEELTPKKIEIVLARAAEREKWGRRRLTIIAHVSEPSPGDLESQGHLESRALRHASA
jgi:hypothetical protein